MGVSSFNFLLNQSNESNDIYKIIFHSSSIFSWGPLCAMSSPASDRPGRPPAERSDRTAQSFDATWRKERKERATCSGIGYTYCITCCTSGTGIVIPTTNGIPLWIKTYHQVAWAWAIYIYIRMSYIIDLHFDYLWLLKSGEKNNEQDYCGSRASDGKMYFGLPPVASLRCTPMASGVFRASF